MHLLIVSRVSIPAKDRTLPAWEYLRSLGHTVTVEHPDSVPSSERPDVMISMGITVMSETFRALERFPGVPAYMYNWDVYEWVWEPGQGGKKQAYHASRNQGQQREYDYVEYGRLLAWAREIWVPSNCTGVRTHQWYGHQNWKVVMSACPWWDYPCKTCGGNGRVEMLEHCPTCKGSGSGVRDDGYALMCLREIPDPHWGLFERACTELGIPYKTPRHELSYAEYQDAVAGCRFICAPLYELSTGGLSLLEAYRLGKPVLISGSPWNAAGEYFPPDRRYTFRPGDIEHLKIMLDQLYREPPEVHADHKEWVEKNFSDRQMVNDMLARIEVTK